MHKTRFIDLFLQGKLNALSPKDDVTYVPNIVRYKTTIQTKIVQFFNTTVNPSFVDLDNYIVDIFVGVHKVCFLVCVFNNIMHLALCLWSIIFK